MISKKKKEKRQLPIPVGYAKKTSIFTLLASRSFYAYVVLSEMTRVAASETRQRVSDITKLVVSVHFRLSFYAT